MYYDSTDVVSLAKKCFLFSPFKTVSTSGTLNVELKKPPGIVFGKRCS